MNEVIPHSSFYGLVLLLEFFSLLAWEDTRWEDTRWVDKVRRCV